jgi:hypothetical protein
VASWALVRKGWVAKTTNKKTTGTAGAPQKNVPPGFPPRRQRPATRPEWRPPSPRRVASPTPAAQLPPPSRCFEFKMATRPVWGSPIGPEVISPPQATKTGGFLTEKAALKRNSVKNNNNKCYMLQVCGLLYSSGWRPLLGWRSWVQTPPEVGTFNFCDP